MRRQYVFGPLERRGFLGVRAAQVGLVTAATTVAVGTLAVWPSAPGAALALLVVGLGLSAATLPIAGRSADQWAPVLAAWVLGEVSGEHRWASPAARGRGHRLQALPGGAATVAEPPPPALRPVPRVAAGGDEAVPERWVRGVRRLGAGEALPPYLRGLQLLGARWRDGDGGEIGVVKDSRAGTYVAVVSARGRGLALREAEDKERLLAHWGSVLAGLAMDASVSRVQWLERTVPDDSEAVVRHLEGSAARPGAWVDSYLALLDEAARPTRSHEVLVAVQVSAARAQRAIRSLRASTDVGACELLSRQVNALAEQLHGCEVDVGGVLGPRALAAALRQAADPAARTTLGHRGAVHPELAGAAPRAAWPHRSRAAWSWLHTDSGWHATYWIAEWPRTPVRPEWMAPLLLDTVARRTVSVVIEPLAPTAALRRVEAARTDDETTDSIRSRLGFRRSVRRGREEDNRARREEELNDGHCECRMSAYVTVTALSLAELRSACAEVEQRARQCGLDVRREDGTQDLAWTYGLPLCRGLA